MTEAEWLACADPEEMLEHLDRLATERKLRLFACACCRRVWPLLSCSDEQRRAVEVAERHADGLACPEELSEAEEAMDSSGDFRDSAAEIAVQGGWDGHEMAIQCAAAASWSIFYYSAGDDAAKKAREAHEKEAQSRLLREVLGSPFRPVTVPPACRPPQVVALAQAAYDHREIPSGQLDPCRLAVLADALEEAGYADPEVLGHLRSPGPHVRGCFALDAILGKS